VEDNTPPVITCPPSDTLYTTMTSCGAVVGPNATAFDNCGVPIVTQVGNLSYLVGSVFPANDSPHLINFKATDFAGNVSTCSFSVLVRDTIPPVITNCPSSDIVVYAENNSCSKVVDYGTIEQGADGVREFVFTNTGKSPLIISNAVGSCGCTVPTWPKEPIKPGQKAAIKVKYDTKRIGAINKSVTITSNATEPTKIIRIKGTVVAPKTSPIKEAVGAPAN